MASVYKRGKRYVAQIVVNGNRIAASLGRIDRRSADLARSMIGQLEQSVAGSGAMPSSVAAWLADAPDELHAGVVRLGLAEPREQAKSILPTTIGKLFDDYLATRFDLAANSKTNIEQARDTMVKHFGPTKVAARVTAIDAEAWQRGLRVDYAAATVSGHTKKAKQVFRDAQRRKLIRIDPMAGLKAGAQSNGARSEYVSAEKIAAVLDVAVDPQWRLLIALSRFGGLRVPTEAAALTWGDVRWASRRLMVKSPKTKRHGRATREVPIFDELAPLLRACEPIDRDPAAPVLPILRGRCNLRTQFAKLIAKAGVEPWPRIFHNLRASRQTELANVLPAHAVCKIMGNTIAVATEHYLQTTPEHWLIALSLKTTAQTTAPHTYLYAPVAQVGRMNNPENAENRVLSSSNAVSAIPPRGFEPRSTG